MRCWGIGIGRGQRSGGLRRREATQDLRSEVVGGPQARAGHRSHVIGDCGAGSESRARSPCTDHSPSVRRSRAVSLRKREPNVQRTELGVTKPRLIVDQTSMGVTESDLIADQMPPDEQMANLKDLDWSTEHREPHPKKRSAAGEPAADLLPCGAQPSIRQRRRSAPREGSLPPHQRSSPTGGKRALPYARALHIPEARATNS